MGRCLPQFLLKRNRRGTTHRIITGFFLLTVSILLKVRRARLPRRSRASWTGTVVGIAAVTAGIVGNGLMNPHYLRVFLEYFLPTVLVVSVVLWRIDLLRGSLLLISRVEHWIPGPNVHLARTIERWIREIDCSTASRIWGSSGHHLRASEGSGGQRPPIPT